MKLYFFRHGQTEWNRLKRIQGGTDIELTMLGEQHADELANDLLHSHLKISKIYTSTQKRALRTAEILANKLEVPVIRSEALKEINLGKWEGNTWKEVECIDTQQFHYWFHHRRYAAPHGGESYQQLLERVVPEIELMVQSNTEDIAVVTHSAVIMCVQCLVNNTAFEKMSQYKPRNLEWYEFDVCLLERMKQRLFI